jgi:hypothetical protein
VPGYLWWNGYIPALQMNSHYAQGRPNGVIGVPEGYRPAGQPPESVAREPEAERSHVPGFQAHLHRPHKSE